MHKREWEKELLSSHLLLHFIKVCNVWDHAMLKSRVGNSAQGPTWVLGTQSLEPSTLSSSICVSRKWESGGRVRAWAQVWDTGILTATLFFTPGFIFSVNFWGILLYMWLFLSLLWNILTLICFIYLYFILVERFGKNYFSKISSSSKLIYWKFYICLIL